MGQSKAEDARNGYRALVALAGEGWGVLVLRQKGAEGRWTWLAIGRRVSPSKRYNVEVMATGKTAAEALSKLKTGARREWESAIAKESAEIATEARIAEGVSVSTNSHTGDGIESNA